MNYSDLRVGKYYLIISSGSCAYYKYTNHNEFTFIKDVSRDTFDNSYGAWTEKWLIRNKNFYLQSVIRELTDEEKVELL